MSKTIYDLNPGDIVYNVSLSLNAENCITILKNEINTIKKYKSTMYLSVEPYTRESNFLQNDDAKTKYSFYIDDRQYFIHKEDAVIRAKEIAEYALNKAKLTITIEENNINRLEDLLANINIS